MLLLATEVWRTHGGIQRYMRMITTILAKRRDEFFVLSLLDHDAHRPAEATEYCLACNSSKLTFVITAVRLGISGKAQTLVVGHTGLLPIAWILKALSLTTSYALVLHGIEAWRKLSWLSRRAAQNASYIVATTTYTA